MLLIIFGVSTFYLFILIPIAVLVLSDVNYFAWVFVYIQQHGAVSYINDALKEGTQISTFHKDAIGRDRTDTSY